MGELEILPLFRISLATPFVIDICVFSPRVVFFFSILVVIIDSLLSLSLSLSLSPLSLSLSLSLSRVMQIFDCLGPHSHDGDGFSGGGIHGRPMADGFDGSGDCTPEPRQWAAAATPGGRGVYRIQARV